MKKTILLITSILLSTLVFSQPKGPTLIKEINTGNNSTISDFAYKPIIFKDKLYINTRAAGGDDLYIYEGDTLKSFTSIHPSTSITRFNFSNRIIFNNKLYFAATNGINGVELWEYDGIDTPRMLDDILPGNEGSYPKTFTIYNNKLMFVARDEVPNTNQLFEYDGINKPVRVSPKNLPWGSVSSQNYIVFNNKLYYEGIDSSHGYELWAYDGINESSLVYDIYPGKTNGDLRRFLIMYDKLYFEGRDQSGNFKTYSLDENETVIEQPAGFEGFTGQFGSKIDNIILYNNIYYFLGQDYANGGTKLWKYDGTNPPSQVNIPEATDDKSIVAAVLYKDQILFQTNPIGDEYETYTYDFNKTLPIAPLLFLNPQYYTIYHDVFYSLYINTAGDREFGSYNGTEGTLINDINVGDESSLPKDYIIYNGKLIFSAETEQLGRELYVYETEDKSSIKTINNNIIIYPNPTSDMFNVELDYSFGEVSYTLTDATGKVIKQSTLNNQSPFSISLANNVTGVYYLTIQSNNYITVKKVIKL